ncbi:hypothetical protein [Segetibacter aerophilus]|uniref:Uncharacterized protein n=1 Tax=Segetibacter aerophilus TaxID=670293 RepID=A0A512B9T1_9BACT|nr:hypothetical protein [Segetibacter aerophilus]GEO08715.1 hypothetical protein SAE01_12110 [Segetibacter aerophilus]
MSDKSNKTISVVELRSTIKQQLVDVAKKLDSHDRMQIAINLKIDLVTVKRYMDGKLEDIRRLELAEQILNEAEGIAEAKSCSAVTT